MIVLSQVAQEGLHPGNPGHGRVLVRMPVSEGPISFFVRGFRI